MSKVAELRNKYPKLTDTIFNKFVESDTTPTKKYLEYLLKTWEKRSEWKLVSSKLLIDAVRKFDELLPYIENKDIYSKDYSNPSTLRRIVRDAEIIKEEKTFAKEDHVITYLDNDNFLMIQPKTHRGSCRYGAGTKWCTASKNNESIFSKYTKQGLLIYLIRKKNCQNSNFDKIALNLEYQYDASNSTITIYSANDSTITTSMLLKNEWTEEQLLEIFCTFRHIFSHQKKYNKIIREIDGFVNTVSTLNFKSLQENILKLDDYTDISYISNIKENLDIFLNEIRKTTDAIRKTKN